MTDDEIIEFAERVKKRARFEGLLFGVLVGYTSCMVVLTILHML